MADQKRESDETNKIDAAHEDRRGRPGSDQSTSDTMEAFQNDISRQIGPYRILEKIGEGGMGVVYKAIQESPKRHVALKIIKLGMDTHAVISRFRAEQQALALMNHTNVAKVFDAGATDDGRPYFVMELIRGLPITEHCDRERLSIDDRLGLFKEVCEAVQHAHQKGIIHRDIKPSNVLVEFADGMPTAKVIDFGVAKAINQPLTEETLFTEQGQMIGTPAYMSPEQADLAIQDIDTRTDVYSLGVLLYELVTGTLPIDITDFKKAGLEAVRKMIREQDPPRPSTRLSGSGSSGVYASDQLEAASNLRRTDSRSLVRRLRGDIDWIVMRCLEKERSRRYVGANTLAEDIARYLSGEPVSAGPPGIAYQLKKFAARNRLLTALALSTLPFIAIIIGLLYYVAYTTTNQVKIYESLKVAATARAFGIPELQRNALQIVLDLDDKNTDALFQMGMMHQELGQAQLAQDPADAQILFALAMDYANRCVDLDRENGRCLNLQAVLLGRLGEHEKADQKSQLAVEMLEGDLGSTNSSSVYAKELALKGELGAAARAIERAFVKLDEFSASYNLSADVLRFNKWNSGVWRTLGMLQLQLGETYALGSFDSAVMCDPEDGRSYLVRAKAKLRSGLLEGALADARFARDDNDPVPRDLAYQTLAWISFELGDYEGCKIFASGCLFRPTEYSFITHLLLAAAESQLGNDRSDIESHLKQASIPVTDSSQVYLVYVDKEILWFEQISELQRLRDIATGAIRP